MLFVMEPKELSKRDTLLLHIIPTLLVFFAFLGVSLWSAYAARQELGKEKFRQEQQVVESTEQSIRDRVAVYEEVLRASVGLFSASEFVSRTEWRDFASTFKLPEHYPGVQGLAYGEIVPKASLGAHEATVRSDGLPNYAVRPAGERDVYLPVTYIEPVDSRNSRVLGFDMLTNNERREAMDEARDTNTPIISKRIQLLQDIDQPNEPGLLMYLPIFHRDAPTNTTEERRTAVKGFVYAPFRARDFFGSIFSNVQTTNPNVQFQVYEGRDKVPQKLLYQSPDFDKVTNPFNTKDAHSFLINNRELTISYRIPPDNISRTLRTRPANTLFGGILFSVILAGLVLVLLISRTRALAYAEAREVQQAKDDLLSLASHQLRTPATGVKQYIGMLRQGYAGKLTTTQKELIDHAYKSNERQLGIIDEILHVARIDTGRMVLHPQKTALSQMVADIISEHHDTIKSRGQKLKFQKPKRAIYAHVDQQYIRMVIENLLSNASKYTNDGGTISVTTASNKEEVTITIKDTGVGIAKQDQHLLFKKFSRIHNERTRQTDGSGIGLYIANKIIDLHGGHISVESEVSAGTTFVVHLPKRTTTKARQYNKENT